VFNTLLLFVLPAGCTIVYAHMQNSAVQGCNSSAKSKLYSSYRSTGYSEKHARVSLYSIFVRKHVIHFHGQFVCMWFSCEHVFSV